MINRSFQVLTGLELFRILLYYDDPMTCCRTWNRHFTFPGPYSLSSSHSGGSVRLASQPVKRPEGSPSRPPERAPKEDCQNGPFSSPSWRGSSELPSRREHSFHRFSRAHFGAHFGVILGPSWDPWAPKLSPKGLQGPLAGLLWGLHLHLQSLSELPWRHPSCLVWLPAPPESPEGLKIAPK